MERTHSLSGNLKAADHATNSGSAKVEDSAQVAHETIDKIAENASAQVDHSAEAVHHAIDRASDTTMYAAEWASTLAAQGRQMHARFAESASTSIRARPFAMVAGAVAVGFLLGRLARR